MVNKKSSVRFLMEKLNEFHNIDNSIGIKYGYKPETKLHTIEFSTVNGYLSDEMMDVENSIEDEFCKLFPDENIQFLTVTKRFNLDHPIFKCTYKDGCKECITEELPTISKDDLIIPIRALEYAIDIVESTINDAELLEVVAKDKNFFLTKGEYTNILEDSIKILEGYVK